MVESVQSENSPKFEKIFILDLTAIVVKITQRSVFLPSLTPIIPLKCSHNQTVEDFFIRFS